MIGQELNQSGWTILKNKVLATSHKKISTISIPDWKIHFFQEKRSQNFSTLRHIPSEHDILTTIAPNQMRLEPLEIRHLELSKHIKFEKNGAQKGLQTPA